MSEVKKDKPPELDRHPAENTFSTKCKRRPNAYCLTEVQMKRYKNYLCRHFKKQLKKDGKVYVNDWIDWNCHQTFKHTGVYRSIAYLMQGKNHADVERVNDDYFVELRPWHIRHAFKIGVATHLFAGMVGAAATYLATNKPIQKVTLVPSLQQVQQADSLNGLVSNLQTEVQLLQDPISDLTKRLDSLSEVVSDLLSSGKQTTTAPPN